MPPPPPPPPSTDKTTFLSRIEEALGSICTRIKHTGSSIYSSIAFLLGLEANEASAGVDEQRWLPMPLSMKLCLVTVFFWACFHAFCCCRPSVTVKPGHRAHFVLTSGRSHLALILFGSVLVALAPITLAWGYGEMSMAGEPLPHPWPYRLFVAVVWAIGCFALCGNVWIEDYFCKRGDVIWIKKSFGRRLQDWAKIAPNVPSVVRWPLAAYLGISLVLYCLLDFSLEDALNEANRIPTYWRSMTLTTGVSPLVPLMALTFGLYGWFWYSLQGKALFREDRPILPAAACLAVPQRNGTVHDLLRMLSREWAARPMEKLCDPFSRRALAVAGICFVSAGVIARLVSGGLPIRNVGSKDYSVVFCVWLGLCTSIMLANAWQLLQIWLKLRHMLLFLDRLPMRRTFEGLRGISWDSVWKMSGNVLDVRYKLVFRQLESLNRLNESLRHWGLQR